MKQSIIAISLTLFSVISFGALPKVEKVKMGNQAYEVINSPSIFSGRPAPLLVIAPAKKYTMTGLIFEKLAERASKLGYHVVRFNWGFVTKKSNPSKDLSVESEDLNKVITHFAKKPYIDNKNIVLAAKSFGSRIAMKGAVKKATSLLLLTPNCDSKNTFQKNYAPIFGLKKNVHIIISKDDPYCDVGQIHASMKKLNKDFVTLHTLAGDHNFKIAGPGSKLNEDTAIDSAINWLNLQIL